MHVNQTCFRLVNVVDIKPIQLTQLVFHANLVFTRRNEGVVSSSLIYQYLTICPALGLCKSFPFQRLRACRALPRDWDDYQ